MFVHCAGILSNNKVSGTSANEWQKVMVCVGFVTRTAFVRISNSTLSHTYMFLQAINVDSAFYLSREFLPAMKVSNFGRIVMIGSLAAKVGVL